MELEPGSKYETRAVENDPRFPNTNQAQRCWTLYNEWVFCLKQNNKDESLCTEKRWRAGDICPESWIDKWDEQREEGIFAGVQIDE